MNTVATSQAPAQVAKAALRRLALAKLEPTPENYARAYAEESGGSHALLPERLRPLLDRLVAFMGEEPEVRQELVTALMDGRWDAGVEGVNRSEAAHRAFAEQWAPVIERLLRGMETTSRQWTPARRRESVQRVLAGSRADARRLQQRLLGLLSAWEGSDAADDQPRVDDSPAAAAEVHAAGAGAARSSSRSAPDQWPRVVSELRGTVAVALPEDDVRARDLADRLAALGSRIAAEGSHGELVDEVASVCEQARGLLRHRHRLVDDLAALCRELGQGLSEAAEDDSWARGQAQALQARLADGIQSRSVRAAITVLADIRTHQQRLKTERRQARDELKAMIRRLLEEVGALDEHTDRFAENLGRHVGAVEAAKTLEGLSDVVREMLADSRSVQQVVRQARERMQGEHSRAVELEARVRDLESELRRLSDEATTDALTQVSNRRGLTQAFDAEVGRVQRNGSILSLALIDIDNFKKLNDSLGHAVGDQALKSLAAGVRERLRQGDQLARYGGEEFVILLPATSDGEAQELLTRLQRSLSSALFMHGGSEVFVTFSAGVTQWRAGETMDAALERADEALYEAKRTGKNRTCRA